MTPEQETELANAIVECGAGYRDTGFYYIDPETDGLCAELFILDGRVVLAMMEKQQRRINIFRDGDMWHAVVILPESEPPCVAAVGEYNESLAIAINSACVKALV